MTRRGFLGTLAALAIAPLAGAFNVRPKAQDWSAELLIGPYRYKRWSNYTTTYANVTEDDWIRAMRRATIHWTPAGGILQSSQSDRATVG